MFLRVFNNKEANIECFMKETEERLNEKLKRKSFVPFDSC